MFSSRISAMSCTALVAGIALPAQAAGKAPLELQPSTDWRVLERTDKCMLQRVYGAGETRTTLMIEQGGMEPAYNIKIVGPHVRNPQGRAIQIQFGPNEKPSSRGYITAKTNSKRPALVMYGARLAPMTAQEAEITPPDVGIGHVKEAAIEWLSISGARLKPFTFELGSMGEPFKDLASCAVKVGADLNKASNSNLGIPQSGQSQTMKARPPEPAYKAGSWIQPKNYPYDLVRQGMEGKVQFRLTVNEHGKPTGCHIAATNRPQMFDDIVCLNLLKRAKFKPATDAGGKPRAAYWSGSVQFRIP